ncbi:TPA: hypothetical protein ACPSKE_002939 [Legionella feeleii]
MDNGWSIAGFLLKAWRFIFPTKKDSHTIQRQNQKSGDGSKNMQAGRDINIKEDNQDDNK